MAGTLTITYQNHRTVKKITFDWLSDADGDVSATHTTYLSGQILRVVFDPDGGGTQPSDLYDVTLIDDNGVDVLDGLGANLSNATTTSEVPVFETPAAIDDLLELVVANAGNAKGGLVILYMR